MYIKPILTCLTTLTLLSCDISIETEVVTQKDESPAPLEILMLGTFHFNNPGADVIKTASFDILSEASQKELEEITDAIENYAPSKIFVEWPFEQQQELDSLYAKYMAGNYFKDSTLSNFYRKNEIFQLAFRAAKKLGLDKVHAIDYTHASFPFDSLMTVIHQANQEELMAAINEERARQEKEVNDMILSGVSLKERLLLENSDNARAENVGLYITYLTKAGPKDNFVGAYLASEWYRRNIYTFSLFQKEVTMQDERVMLLFGSAHIALLDQILKTNSTYKLVELETLMSKNR